MKISYRIEFSTQAKKFLRRLDKIQSLRILNKFEELRSDPFRYIEHYEGDGYKLRIGDIRCLIDIQFDSQILLIRIIDKRGRIYKR